MTHQLALNLLREPTAAFKARQAVRQACADLDDEDLTATAQMLTSELVTNAVQHGEGEITLTLDREVQGMLRFEVTDESHRMPRRLSGDVLRFGGRGLLVVEAYADAWGVDRRPQGKSVWFTLHSP